MVTGFGLLLFCFLLERNLNRPLEAGKGAMNPETTEMVFPQKSQRGWGKGDLGSERSGSRCYRFLLFGFLRDTFEKDSCHQWRGKLGDSGA